MSAPDNRLTARQTDGQPDRQDFDSYEIVPDEGKDAISTRWVVVNKVSIWTKLCEPTPAWTSARVTQQH